MKNNQDRFFTIKMTRALEDNAFASGITVSELMEQAGKAVAEEIKKSAEKIKTNKIVFLAGFGNNGGDALVAARYLLEKDYKCEIILVGDKNEFNSPAAQRNFDKLANKEIKWLNIKKTEEIESILSKYDSSYIFIDAIFGIGISGEIREPYKSVIEILNEKLDTNIIALDIPSGYDPALENNLYLKNVKKIVNLGRNKIQKDHFNGSEIVVKDIGIPDDCENYVGIGDLKWFYPERKVDSHKRQNGVVTIIGGSKEYVGAPALSALGALRTGADLTFLQVPKNIRSIIASYTPDFITIPAHEDEIEPLDVVNLLIQPRIEGSSFVIGPGMMDTETTKDTLLELLKSKTKKQIIIDAGALSMMEKDHLFLLKYHDTILTPHRGEFYTVFKKKLSGDHEIDSNLIAEVAKKWETTILLKGKTDIISNGNRIKFNTTGHPGMTVGGTGDVLTGIVASLLSVLKDTFISACLGAYISGAAGEIAAKSYGDGLIASDIPNFIYPVIANALSFKAKEI